jgi:hypothetical protein
MSFMLITVLSAALLASTTPTPAPTYHAQAAKPPAAAASPAWHPVVPFIEDDFGRALAVAKSRKLPVFIEGWAPW